MAEMVRDQEVVSAADADKLAARIAAAFPRTQALHTHLRAKILSGVADGLEKEAEAFAKLICEEVKKPMKDARKEVARAIFTFRWAAEEVKRFSGELLPLDLDPAGEGRVALTKRFSRGPALLITPFNFPLNLVAHKVAPAIAVGTPFVLKPAPQAPRTALALAKLIRAAGWPAESMAVVNCPVEAAEALVRDERFGVVSFTGSAKVGWYLKSIAGKKHVVLELGGNAGAFIASDADVAWAAARCAWGAYYYSGQVCISVQRILVEAPVYEEFKSLLLANIKELKQGDPAKDETDIGPLIDTKSADRVQSWIEEAVSAGGKVLAGGPRQGDTIAATLVESVPASCKLSCEEAFGPVATLEKVASREEAYEKLASGSYGLQAGLFTNDLKGIMSAWSRIPVGGLIVNDIPAYRSDAMPYGGVKDSGTGREGVRYAMEEFTELRTLVLKP
jgi:acyl-CoA reductase-like NAD-dependent aldehyde dehydrogenase